MIPVTTTKDKAQLRIHALELLKQKKYEGLVIIAEDLREEKFRLPNRILKNAMLGKAVDGRHFRVITCLVNNGADIDHAYGYPIGRAAYNGDVEMVEHLFNLGSKIYITPLDHALKANNLEIVKFFIDRDMGVPYTFTHASEEGYSHIEIIDYILNNSDIRGYKYIELTMRNLKEKLTAKKEYKLLEYFREQNLTGGKP